MTPLTPRERYQVILIARIRRARRLRALRMATIRAV